MLVGALPSASGHCISHVSRRCVSAYTSQRLPPLQHGYRNRCAASFNDCRNEQRRRLATSPTIGSKNVLAHIEEFTTQYPVSVFRSVSNNPYHNLAIENYLLKRSQQNSKILFTYTNRPCLVFGRNQNPWLECNITKAQEGLPDVSRTKDGRLVPLDLVRRRSGGGTVVQDLGNLNFSFIVPNDKDFTRDKHAWLVVSMLHTYRGCADRLFDKVRVNERHDIVMTRRSGSKNPKDAQEYKASGSAFKLTRGRALHHGTLLHSSPNVGQASEGDVHTSTFSTLLSSPAKAYLMAKGVGSVRSPVHNLFHVKDANQRWQLASDMETALRNVFRSLYKEHNAPCVVVGDEDCQRDVNKDICDDVQEMTTDEWRFCQTPTFEYGSTHGDGNVKLKFEVNHGIIKSSQANTTDKSLASMDAFACLEGKKLHEVQSWGAFFSSESSTSPPTKIINHLATVFPKIHLAKAKSTMLPADGIIEEKDAKKTAPGGNVIKRKSREGKIEVEEGGENVVVER